MDKELEDRIKNAADVLGAELNKIDDRSEKMSTVSSITIWFIEGSSISVLEMIGFCEILKGECAETWEKARKMRAAAEVGENKQ